MLTQYIDWRSTLFVNLVFAIPAAAAALVLLVNERPAVRPKLDLPGAATATTGLFALVYGFSNAETHSWGAPLTIGSLAASAVLLATFVLLQSRGKHPLLPLRVLDDAIAADLCWPWASSGLGCSGCSCSSPTTCSAHSASAP